jgi:hypothetical protein
LEALQAAIIRALHELNQQTVDLSAITAASPPNCFVNFEFGVADSDAFCFIDKNELNRLERALKAQALSILDLFCGARYHIKKEKGKRQSLQFDYSLLRLTFERQNVDLSAHYVRGNQRIPRKDFVLYLKSQIDKELTAKQHDTMMLARLF